MFKIKKSAKKKSIVAALAVAGLLLIGELTNNSLLKSSLLGGLQGLVNGTGNSATYSGACPPRFTNTTKGGMQFSVNWNCTSEIEIPDQCGEEQCYNPENNKCYDPDARTTIGDGMDKYVGCSQVRNRWGDFDAREYRCKTNGFPWILSGEPGVGEFTDEFVAGSYIYNGGNPTFWNDFSYAECCGDDADEYMISKTINGQLERRCCNSLEDSLDDQARCTGYTGDKSSFETGRREVAESGNSGSNYGTLGENNNTETETPSDTSTPLWEQNVSDLIGKYQNITLPTDPSQEFYQEKAIEDLLGTNAPDFENSSSPEEAINKFFQEQNQKKNNVLANSAAAIYDENGNIIYYLSGDIAGGGSSGTGNNNPAGTAWSDANGAPMTLTNVGYGDGTWVSLAGPGGKYASIAFISTDGKNWAPHETGISLPHTCDDMVYAEGMFLASCRHHSGIVKSSDKGLSWERTYDGDEGFSGIAYGKGKFVAIACTETPAIVGHILSSDDGENWSKKSIPGICPRAVAYGNDMFMVGTTGNKKVYISTDGENFQPRTYPYANRIDSLAYGNGKWVSGACVSETNGFSWTCQTRGTVPGWAIEFVNGQFFTAGDGGTYASSDGYSWTKVNTGTPRAVFDIATNGSMVVIASSPLEKMGIMSGIKYSPSPVPKYNSGGGSSDSGGSSGGIYDQICADAGLGNAVASVSAGGSDNCDEDKILGKITDNRSHGDYKIVCSGGEAGYLLSDDLGDDWRGNKDYQTCTANFDKENDSRIIQKIACDGSTISISESELSGKHLGVLGAGGKIKICELN